MKKPALPHWQDGLYVLDHQSHLGVRRYNLRGILPTFHVLLWGPLRDAFKGGSDRRSRRITLFTGRRQGGGNFKRATTYRGGSNTQTHGSQIRFTTGHVSIGSRPRPLKIK